MGERQRRVELVPQHVLQLFTLQLSIPTSRKMAILRQSLQGERIKIRKPLRSKHLWKHPTAPANRRK